LKTYLKVLIVAAFAIPVFIELRTLFGDFVGGVDGISLSAAVVAAIFVSVVVVLVDEAISGGGGSGGSGEGGGGSSEFVDSGD